MRSKLASLLTSGDVTRYHVRHMLQRQTTGHHAYNVALLCQWLHPECGKELLLAALLHDAGERWVGDIPSPTKRRLGSQAIDVMESDALYARTDLRSPALSAEEGYVLKLADALEGLHHCHAEYQFGNRRHMEMYANYDSYVYALVFDNPLIYTTSVKTRATEAYSIFCMKARETVYASE